VLLPQEEERNRRAQRYLLSKKESDELVVLQGTPVVCLVHAGGPWPLIPKHAEAWRQLCAQGEITLQDLKIWQI
jgi:hypothetical protein